MAEGEVESITSEELLEPIEILVALAKSGEIDPWNIDIVEVTDKFLQQVEELERMDLRVSGRTLLYAAVLLRMKSNVLVEMDEPEDIPDDCTFDDSDDFSASDYPVPSLPLRRHSKRPVTLQELLSELKMAEKTEKRRVERTKTIKEERRVTVTDVLSIAHDEDIESRVGKMKNLLDGLFEKQQYIKFSELSEALDRSGKVMAYLAILFLATRKEIWLEQEEIFGEIFIRRWEAL